MDTQHTNITGYRKLTSEEVDLVNTIKGNANVIGMLCDELAKCETVDKRWLAIARTDLQKGFMCLTRAITKPESF
jgi:hypothetical protein